MEHFILKNVFLLRTGLIAIGFITLVLLAMGVSPAYAGCVVVYSEQFVRVVAKSGGPIMKIRNPVSATTKEQCEAKLRSSWAWSNDIYFRQSYCECDSPSGYSGYSGGGKNNMQMQMMQSILQPFFNNLFEPLFAPPDTSRQDEIARQNAINQQQKEAQNKAGGKRKGGRRKREKRGEAGGISKVD